MSQDLENLRKLFEARRPVPKGLTWYAGLEQYKRPLKADPTCENSYNNLWQGFLLMVDELGKRDAEIARLNLSLEDAQQANAQWAVKYKADVADLAPAQRIAYLQEIREPSENVISAALLTSQALWVKDIAPLWQAMIDAKIAEEGKI